MTGRAEPTNCRIAPKESIPFPKEQVGGPDKTACREQSGSDVGEGGVGTPFRGRQINAKESGDYAGFGRVRRKHLVS